MGLNHSNTQVAVEGNVANATPDVGNPVKTGTKTVNPASLPTFAVGQRSDTLSNQNNGVTLVQTQLPTGAANINTGQVNITAVSAILTPINSLRRKIIIANHDASNILYIGNIGVTTTTGTIVQAKSNITLDTTAAIYGIGSGNLVASYVEIYD
jgi:hypothetical protein